MGYHLPWTGQLVRRRLSNSDDDSLTFASHEENVEKTPGRNTVCGSDQEWETSEDQNQSGTSWDTDEATDRGFVVVREALDGSKRNSLLRYRRTITAEDIRKAHARIRCEAKEGKLGENGSQLDSQLQDDSPVGDSQQHDKDPLQMHLELKFQVADHFEKTSRGYDSDKTMVKQLFEAEHDHDSVIEDEPEAERESSQASDTAVPDYAKPTSESCVQTNQAHATKPDLSESSNACSMIRSPSKKSILQTDL